MKAFTSIAGDSWLQGRRLIPILSRHGERVRGAVLDLGCGASPMRPLFPNAARYLRMDRYPVDAEVITIEDPRKLPLDAGSVEVILLSRMLGDLPDIVGAMGEFRRVLAPGGRILVYEAMSYPQHDLPHDYWRVLPGGLTWAAEQVGMKVEQLEYLGGYFTQLAMHWNVFIVADLGGYALTRPIAKAARAACNVVCAGLDRLLPRPTLATDYFACVVKPGSGESEGFTA